MFENIGNFFKKIFKSDNNSKSTSGKEAKERLHLVLMQDRANVSADFLDMMKQEIIEVIKKYIDVDENAIDVRLTNQTNEDGTNGAPALYANIPIINIKENDNKVEKEEKLEEDNVEENKEEKKDTENEDIKEDKKEIENDTEKENNKDNSEDTEVIVEDDVDLEESENEEEESEDNSELESEDNKQEDEQKEESSKQEENKENPKE